MTSIIDYLNRVDGDAKMQHAHDINPLAAMRGFGLSDVQCDALMSGDNEMIAAVEGFDGNTAAAIQVPHTGPGPGASST
jgi:hypothetical protein